MAVETQNSDVCLSLDEYIKKKKVEGSLCFLDYRKKERNINKEELDEHLDKIAKKNAAKSVKKNGLSKFDRFNDDDSDSESEEDDDCGVRKIRSDVEMMDLNEPKSELSSIRFAKELQQMEHPDCCKISKPFTTVESNLGIKIKSQQWRIQNGMENGESSSYSELNLNKIRNGRVNKNNNGQKNGVNKANAGVFVEKGNFTYKFKDNNGSVENGEKIVGIVRNKPHIKFLNGNRQPNSPNVNINMNWNGFFKGVAECMQTLSPIPEKSPTLNLKPTNNGNIPDDLQVKIAASELFEYLLAKRGKTSTNTMQNNNFMKNSSNPLNEYIVNARAGDGVEMKVAPKTTNIPMNLRFA